MTAPRGQQRQFRSRRQRTGQRKKSNLGHSGAWVYYRSTKRLRQRFHGICAVLTGPKKESFVSRLNSQPECVPGRGSHERKVLRSVPKNGGKFVILGAIALTPQKEKLFGLAFTSLTNACQDHYSKSRSALSSDQYWKNHRSLPGWKSLDSYLQSRVNSLIGAELSEVDSIVREVKKGLGV